MKKILVVDADLAQRLALQEIVAQRREWRVVKAGSAHDALARLRSLDLPDLCIFGSSVGEPISSSSSARNRSGSSASSPSSSPCPRPSGPRSAPRAASMRPTSSGSPSFPRRYWQPWNA